MKRILPIFTLVVLIPVFSAFGQAAQPADKVADAASQVKERTTDTLHQIHDEGLSAEQIMSWIVVGALAAGVVGNLFQLHTSRAGIIFDLVIGGVGAFLGGFAVRVLGLDFGWPQVTFSSETMAMAILFSVLLVIAYRFAKRRLHRATGDTAVQK
jgi:uncharacterized membrane protein YeaQ/YmgE (transglycosylase-associated protein family)